MAEVKVIKFNLLQFCQDYVFCYQNNMYEDTLSLEIDFLRFFTNTKGEIRERTESFLKKSDYVKENSFLRDFLSKHGVDFSI